MSPRRTAAATPRVEAELRRVAVTFGVRVRDARVFRHWSVRHLAERAGLSPDMVYRVESGVPVSAQTAARLAVALEHRLEIDLVDGRSRTARSRLSADVVHSAMGEFEAARLRSRHFSVGLDEPYQHYQFAGRADLVAWDLNRRSFLHVENRTRFPDFQEAAGAFNAKRAYLALAIGERVGVPRWASETHVMAGLWSSEILHALRLRTESFRAVCPDETSPFDGWWSGEPPRAGRTSIFVVLDPIATGRTAPYVGLTAALIARARHRTYAELASGLEDAA